MSDAETSEIAILKYSVPCGSFPHHEVLEEGHGEHDHVHKLGLGIMEVMDDEPGSMATSSIKNSYSPMEKIKSAVAIKKVSMVLMSSTAPGGFSPCEEAM